MDLFFYGTLCHRPLLEIVLGRDPEALDVQPAVLPDHAVFWADGEIFPLIVSEQGENAAGLLIRGLDAEDLARLSYYEGGFGYERDAMRVKLDDGEAASAEVFCPDPDMWRVGAPWSLEDWVACWGAVSCRAAQEVMGYYGRVSAQEVAARFPSIRRRAASWVAAQARPADPERDIARDVKVRGHDFAYLNFYGIEEAALQFRRHDGTMSPVLNRSALMVGQAAVVLPYDPVRDTVLLVEQFRAPVYLTGDRAPWVWEPVAGLVDPGETPETAAKREAVEEAGLTVKRLEKAGAAYSSTGSSGEYIHLYIGIADLTETTDTGGLESEGEDIRSAILSFDELMEGMDAHRYRDLPLISTVLWLARHRDRLRAKG